MPRSIQDILDHADELAKRFEDADPGADDMQDATALRQLRDAVVSRADAERAVAAAVVAARGEGHSWAAIGAMLGTSGVSARERYGSLVESKA